MKKLCVGIAVAIFLSACGSTSGLKTAAGQSKSDLKRYDAVLVKTFVDGTKDQDLPGHIGAKFASKLATAIRDTNRFDMVSRYAADTAGKTTLSVEGQITRYEEGDEVTRALIGFGIGSAYFDATVDLADESSGDTIGTITVDKNTMPLGGWVAAYQTPNKFMDGAAKKVAKEVASAKGK